MAKTKISEYSATASNNTDIDNISIAEGMDPADVNNAIRELMAHLKDMDAGTSALTSPDLGAATGTSFTATAALAGKYFTGAKGGDLASAGTLVIGTDGDYFDVTGTTTITDMTVAAGRVFTLQFDGALTLTHGGSLNLPGGANITTAAGDEFTFYAVAADTVRCIGYALASGFGDPDGLTSDTTANLTAGFTCDVYDYGNSGTSTQTVTLTGEALQTLGVTGSFTLAPPSSGNGVAVILATTDGTGGYTITTSGFTKVNGTYDNTASKVHRFTVTKIGSTSILDIDEVA